MKTLIIYSSETGNTKMVCEKAFEYINGEKIIIYYKENFNVTHLFYLTIYIKERGMK